MPTPARAAIRKAAQRLGAAITRDRHARYPDDPADHVVWDVLNPFAPPDPADQHLRGLIQAEIARMRRYESVGPLQPLPGDDADSDAESKNETKHAVDDADADADADDEDEGEDDEREDDRPRTIALPRLLHTRPLCAITSPPSPPPSSSSSDEGPSAPWLAHTCTDTVEAEERARKARRDAHRSRLKALAILGPEASAAI